MDFMERFGYVKREQHNKMLRHKNEMHELLARRADRIAQLEAYLADARETLRVNARLDVTRPSEAALEAFRRAWYIVLDLAGTMSSLDQGKIGPVGAWRRTRAMAVEARALADGPCPIEDEKPWKMKTYFAMPGASAPPSMRPINHVPPVVRNCPSATEYAFGKQPPVNIGNTCSHCAKKIPLQGVTLWVNVDNETDAQQAATGKTQVLPFCSQDCARQHKRGRLRGVVFDNSDGDTCHQCAKVIPSLGGVVLWARPNRTSNRCLVDGPGALPFCSRDCLSRYRNRLPRTDLAPDMTNMRCGFASNGSVWQQAVEARRKHGEEMNAVAAMWGHALGGESPSGNRVFHLDDFHWYGCPGCFRLRERLDSALDEMHRLHGLNKKLRKVAQEDARRIEELRCQAGDLSDRIEKAEHERDKAFADFDRSVGIRRELERERDDALMRLDGSRKLVAHREHERDLARVESEMRNNQLINARESCLAAEHARNRLRPLARMAAPLTDEEAASVVMPLMSDFDCGEDYVRAVQVAINDVTSRRQ